MIHERLHSSPLPFIPGWDVSGVVEAVGSGVTKFKKGDEVYARPDVTTHGYGAYAEFVVAKETETALKPKSIDHVHAATIPVGAVTAWRALFDAAGLKKDQKVLIHGAAGGVGSFAVQLAKWKGSYRKRKQAYYDFEVDFFRAGYATEKFSPLRDSKVQSPNFDPRATVVTTGSA
jgi:NADPH:quinone reductase-like Zn-dependent oxidoreductase